MTEPKVWNLQDPSVPEYAIYVGRGTPFGNPYKIGVDGTRDEVIEKYAELIRMQPDMIQFVKHTLKNQDLMCHCKPERCHGDILLEIANEEE